MRHALTVGQRVLTQLRKDRRYLILSLIAPLVIIYFLNILLQEMPAPVRVRYATPICAFIVHFLSFVLCALILVQERMRGTLNRMFVNGFSKSAIISGYVIGYFGLATLQAVAALAETIWLFNLDFTTEVYVYLFLVIWLLAIVSVMLGIFASTFARHEGHVLPFIPLIILPSMFLSGMLVDASELPRWAELLGQLMPLYYANNIIQELIQPSYDVGSVVWNFAVLAGYIALLLLLAARTLRDTE